MCIWTCTFSSWKQIHLCFSVVFSNQMNFDLNLFCWKCLMLSNFLWFAIFVKFIILLCGFWFLEPISTWTLNIVVVPTADFGDEAFKNWKPSSCNLLYGDVYYAVQGISNFLFKSVFIKLEWNALSSTLLRCCSFGLSGFIFESLHCGLQTVNTPLGPFYWNLSYSTLQCCC